ncbi:hypothetical protein F4780DRAFT_752605 [Xylariomycetidae sp. FL0641]|nr:hypothetical protein F4780DRAFT_752605 [Xylariomycetidae sp. FL0641]
MAPNKNNTKADEVKIPSALDMEVIINVFKCFETEPVIDYVTFAALSGLKDKKAGYKRWWTIKKKYGLGKSTASASSEAGPAIPAKRNRSAGKEGATPDPKRLKTAKTEEDEAGADAVDEDDDEVADSEG